MLIDWFTVGAQILNFLILLFLLKIFLYDKIVGAMDERERRIADQLDEARRKEEEAEQEKADYKERLKDLDDRKKDELSKARQDASKKREELVSEARREVDEMRSKWEQDVAREQDAFLRRLKDMAARQIFRVCRSVLEELANENVEERIIDVFLDKLDALSAEDAKKLAGAGRQDGLTVHSPFELDSSRKSRLTKALRKSLSQDAQVEYETSSDMALGLEVRAPGAKLAWSVEDRMEELDRKAREFLEQYEKKETESMTEEEGA